MRWGGILAGTLEKLDILVHNVSIYLSVAAAERAGVWMMALRQYQINAAAPLVLDACPSACRLLMQSDMKGGGR